MTDVTEVPSMPSSPLSGPVRQRKTSAAGLVGVLAAALCAAWLVPSAAAPAAAQRDPGPAAAPAEAEAAGTVLEQSAQSLPADGTLVLSVRSRIETQTPYYEARFQVLRPGGGLMLQKTEVRNDLQPGESVVRFERELASLGLRPAEYPVRVRVRFGDSSGRTTQHVLEDRVFVYDPERRPLPVAVVVRLAGAPALDPEGRFVSDPALYTRERDEALDLVREARGTGARFSLAVPPLLLNQWRRAADGYRTVGPEGVRDVAAGEPVPLSYAQALAALADLASLDRVELLDVPYAEPDLAGLEAAGAQSDLQRHFARGSSEYLASLEQTPSAGVAVLGDRFTPWSLPALAERGIAYAVVSPGSLEDGDPDRQGGTRAVKDTTTTALVLDEEASGFLGEDPREALGGLFERYLAEEGPGCVIALLEIGPGRAVTARDAVGALRTLAAAGWLETVTAAEAAAQVGGPPVRLAEAREGHDGPADYWPEVAEARRCSSALSAAAGEDDQDAEAAWYMTLLAQSAAWAGPDGSWSMADRGRAFAGAAERRARSLLDSIGLQAEDVTLSGRAGDVPLNVSNRARRPMRVTLRVRSPELGFPEGTERVVELQPADNYLTMPVEMRSALSGALHVSVHAGDMVIAESDIRVYASYLDRVAVVSAVVLVLVGMLVFIKRRVDRADADIIGDGRKPQQ
ncbi:MAG: hypothetical protein IBX62_03830 [Coriobacteriia bacterium]|nr:hypothetical protein [Coriobacteriia bacterium]